LCLRVCESESNIERERAREREGERETDRDRETERDCSGVQKAYGHCYVLQRHAPTQT